MELYLFFLANSPRYVKMSLRLTQIFSQDGHFLFVWDLKNLKFQLFFLAIPS